jgi:hypothetical protein
VGALATESDSSVPNPVLTFNAQDSGSMQMVQHIVEEVLKRLGHSGITLVGKTRPNSRRARETAIKQQQAIMKPEEDLMWKVCKGDCLVNSMAKHVYHSMQYMKYGRNYSMLQSSMTSRPTALQKKRTWKHT